MDDPIKMLMVEDTSDAAELLAREMRRGGLAIVPQWVDTLEGLKDAIERFDPDVILSDYSLPGFGGMSALAITRQRLPDVPFIFVSEKIGAEGAIEALKQGATDFVLKDNQARLVPSIRRALDELKESRVRRRAEQAHLMNEERFRSVADATHEWIWEMDASGVYTFCSPAVEAILGYKPEEIVGQRSLDYVYYRARPSAADQLRSAAREKRGWRGFVLPWRHKNGRGCWVESNSLPLFDSRGAVSGFRGAARDVSERIDQQAKIARLSRIHAAMSGIHSTMVRVRDRDELFREVCRIAVISGRFSFAWIGVVDPVTLDGRVAASAGAEEGYAARIQLTARAGLPSSDLPASRAMCEKTTVIFNNIATDPRMGSAREDALARGYRSLAAFPLASGDSVHGVLVLYCPQTDFFGQDEIQLLNDLAADISFTLDHLDREERPAYMAYHDTVTGLANRELFFDRLKQMMLTASADENSLAIVVVELQRVRNITETLGRSAGDRLVKDFAARLLKTLGESITPARMSDDRFAAVIADKTGAELALYIRRCSIALQMAPLSIDGVELRIAVKFGIAMFPADGTDPETLFSNAEAALRQAQDRVDDYVFYSAEINAAVARRLRLESRLRHAIEKEQFILYYQPKVDLKTEQIMGLEALIRWRDPEHGLISPLEFIPVLEETGMIVGVGLWVIEQVAADMRRWGARKLRVPRVAVNVSQVQLRQKNFVAAVFGALSDSGSKPAGEDLSVTQIMTAEDSESDYDDAASREIGIDIEITESLIAEDTGGNIEKLRQLRAAGMRIYIDDFGTGYSSLSQIAQLPIDALKIDRAFIVNMAERPEHMAVVSTVINLAKALGIVVVAEGVETEAQAGVLRSLGCHQAQGYLYGKPLPPEDTARLL